MNIIIRNGSDQPIYDQIYCQIKSAILKGEVKEGDALPSIRALARDLKISVITTKRAFDDLERDGYVVSVQGKGTLVAPYDAKLRKEEQLKQVESALSAALSLARECGLSYDELVDLLRVLAEEV